MKDMKIRKKIVDQYIQCLRHKESYHNIITKGVREDKILCYEEHEARILACNIQHANNHFQLLRVMQKFGPGGRDVAKSKARQLHERTCFKEITVAGLTKQEKEERRKQPTK